MYCRVGYLPLDLDEMIYTPMRMRALYVHTALKHTLKRPHQRLSMLALLRLITWKTSAQTNKQRSFSSFTPSLPRQSESAVDLMMHLWITVG